MVGRSVGWLVGSIYCTGVSTNVLPRYITPFNPCPTSVPQIPSDCPVTNFYSPLSNAEYRSHIHNSTHNSHSLSLSVTVRHLPTCSFPAVQYSTVQYSTVQCSAVQYSTVQYSTVQCSTVQYSTVEYSAVQYSTVTYSTAQHSTVEYSTVQ